MLVYTVRAGQGREAMKNQGCINGEVDNSTYSSPVPIIGLYIAGASFVCFIMMLWDVILYGLLARKYWLPCRRFKLDSVTLTLLGVAAKLPADLTSSMPSPEDQLSKLTGTAFICVCMGFLVPSLGVTNESECFTNMVALSIFVVTIAANICTQLITGVIVLFFVENIIVLVMMLLLLLNLWQMYLYIKSENRITTDGCSDRIKKGSKSTFERLKFAYMYAYCSNAQLKISIHPRNATVNFICLTCSVIVAEAAVRSLILKDLNFCQGISDYRWSMWLIVITQIVTIILGAFALVFRCLALSLRIEIESGFPRLALSLRRKIESGFRRLALFRSMEIKRLFVSSDDDGVIHRKWSTLHSLHDRVLLRQLLGLYKKEYIEVGEYIEKKGVDEIDSLRNVCNTKPLNHLYQFLLDKPPPSDLCDLEDPSYHFNDLEVCSLSLAFLIKVAQISIPTGDLKSLLLAYSEVSDIIYFIDKTIQPKNLYNDIRLSYAKAVGDNDAEFTCLLPYIDQPPDGVSTIEELKKTLASRSDQGEFLSIIWSRLKTVVDLINHERCSSKELYNNIEQLFIEMLTKLLSQLPIAIFKYLSDSPDEELEERLRVAMKFLFKTECLDRNVQWSFPADFNVSSYITQPS